MQCTRPPVANGFIQLTRERASECRPSRSQGFLAAATTFRLGAGAMVTFDLVPTATFGLAATVTCAVGLAAGGVGLAAGGVGVAAGGLAAGGVGLAAGGVGLAAGGFAAGGSGCGGGRGGSGGGGAAANEDTPM